MIKRSQLAWLVFFLALIVVSERRISASFQWRYPAVNKLIVTENYAGDLGALLMGAHRLAADISYIDFLQYYGVREKGAHEESEQEEHETPVYKHPDFAGGTYPRLKEKATRTLHLDPFFNRAALEAAGALAFNQLRIGESLEFLEDAIRLDPSFYRYHLYVAAILYKNSGQDLKLIDKLLEAMRTPDCPPLLQDVLGNLLKKYGRYDEAARVYLHTYETAASASDRSIAASRLKALTAEQPQTRKIIGSIALP